MVAVVYTVFTCKWMFISVSYCSGFRPLAHATLSILDLHRTPLGDPVVDFCHGDPVTLDLHDQPLYMLQQFTDRVDVGVDQLQNLYLGLADSLVGHLTSSYISTPAQAVLAHPMPHQVRGKVNSPNLPPHHHLKQL